MTFSIRPVEGDDGADIFSWNNHPLSRRNSFRTEPITRDEHARWFAERLADPLTTIYILCKGQEKVGSVRFEEKEGAVRISVMLNPEYIGKRLGATLIRLGTERYVQEKRPKKPIVAEVKSENSASNKAFLKAGYSEAYRVYLFTGD